MIKPSSLGLKVKWGTGQDRNLATNAINNNSPSSELSVISNRTGSSESKQAGIHNQQREVHYCCYRKED